MNHSRLLRRFDTSLLGGVEDFISFKIAIQHWYTDVIYEHMADWFNCTLNTLSSVRGDTCVLGVLSACKPRGGDREHSSQVTQRNTGEQGKH